MYHDNAKSQADAESEKCYKITEFTPNG